MTDDSSRSEVASNGQLVMSTRLQLVAGKGAQVIDLRTVGSGVYILRASSAKGACNLPVVKR